MTLKTKAGPNSVSGNGSPATRPFIKWAGGKWQLIPTLSQYLPSRQQINCYFEPFMGGAAVFFYLKHPKAVLADRNSNLVELYKIVRDDVDSLIAALRLHKNTVDHFYKVRSQDPESLTPVKRAARFIFLNKTCYNGLYRVNSEGKFNVPFGKYKNPTICDTRGLLAANRALQHVTLMSADFERAVAKAKRGDFVYFDPPYQPLSRTSSFTSYTSGKFDDQEQKRLSEVFADLDKRGCFVMLSNSDAPLIRKLYRKFRIIRVQANRAINCKPESRGKITELLIINYSQPDKIDDDSE